MHVRATALCNLQASKPERLYEHAPRPVIPDLPVYIAKALKTSFKAWESFRELTPTCRRHFVRPRSPDFISRLLQAAARVFARHGLKRARMAEVARDMGVAHGSL